jgi:hypothetical protein
MTAETIFVAQDFSDTPGGRYKRLGPASGEEFRDHLVQILKSGKDLIVIVDGAEGYGSSFLEEAFGGLVRLGLWSFAELSRRVQVIAQDKSYELYSQQATKYMKEAADRLNA